MGLFGRAEKYTVQPGDTFQSIAQKYDAKPEAVAKKNKMNVNDRLTPGTVIKVTKGSGSSSSSSD